MAKAETGKEKKDFFTVVMIVQSLVCAILVVLMLLSARADGKFAGIMKNGYLEFMKTDFTGEDFEDAFRSFRDYVAVFLDEYESETVAVFNETEEISETLMQEELPTGGIDLEFSSLETLEGICFEDVDTGIEMSVPLEEYVITSSFGYRFSPLSGETGVHTGLDMAADYGQSVYAAADGVVTDSAWDNSYGNYVKIQHKNNTVTIYAHCSSLCVDEGEKVSAGDRIARVGSTGASTGNHLHFEIRKDNIRINPEYELFGT